MIQKITIQFLTQFAFCFTSLIAQEVKVEKIGQDSSGYQIILSYDNNGSLIQARSGGCSLRPFTKLSDKTKMKIIENLLNFEGDTSPCRNTVGLHNNSYPLPQRPEAKNYSIQLEALFYINYIAMSQNALFYSPFPVLYNWKTKEELKDLKELKNVYKVYKKWFILLKRRGFNSCPCPLDSTRYMWFGAMHPLKTIISYPAWDNTKPCTGFSTDHEIND